MHIVGVSTFVSTHQNGIQRILNIENVHTSIEGVRTDGIGKTGLFVDHDVVGIPETIVISIRLNGCHLIRW